MQTWLSKLSKTLTTQKHRQVIWLAGDHHWAWQIINPWLALFDKNIYVGQADLKHAYLKSVKASKPSTLLGYDCDNVVFDAHHGLFPDALSAIAGTIKPGGFLFFLTPSLDVYPYFNDEFAIGRTSFGMESQSNNANTVKRLIQSAKQHGITILEQSNPSALPAIQPYQQVSNHRNYDEQKTTLLTIIEHFDSHPHSHIDVITADRGRGKSHLLGLLANYLIKTNKDNGIKFFICAPNKASTQSVYKAMPSDISQQLQFIAPELLDSSASQQDVIFIDEAASLPIPLLMQWSKHFKHLIMATTTHGYEGTGKGFQNRFFKHLDELAKKGQHSWQQHKLTHPIRYGANDPIENWLFDVFCLDSEPNTVKLNDSEKRSFRHEYIPKQALLKDADLLKQVFGLLIQAHYQTKPSDLRDLLDAPGLHLLAQFTKTDGQEFISSVCLINDEGPIAHYDALSNDLHADILRGYRRPKGHLIPQVLAFHLGLEQAFELRGARIVRIATLPELQQQGFGSKLLKFVIEHCKHSQYDYLGSSFSSTEDVAGFWRKLEFKTVRQGNKLDKASGTSSALVLYGLSQRGLKIEQQAVQFFEHQDQSVSHFDELKPSEQTLLIQFIDHNGSYESAKAILSRFESFKLPLPKKPSKDFKQLVFDFLFENPAQP